MSKKFLIFSFIGCIIFFIDLAFFIIFNKYFNFTFSRFLSYSFATYFAYLLNKKFTFKKLNSSFIFYYLGTLTAGIQNIFISLILTNNYLSLKINFSFAIAVGCLYGLIFNFIFQNKITFKND